MSYSRLCDHSRLQRIDKNFVRCLDCGQSMISQSRVPTNKTTKDFVKENKGFSKNFNRNFSNELEETDEQTSRPLYEYYTDRMEVNRIIVNRQDKFKSDPPKYETLVNGDTFYLTNQQIQKILNDVRAFRVRPPVSN